MADTNTTVENTNETVESGKPAVPAEQTTGAKDTTLLAGDNGETAGDTTKDGKTEGDTTKDGDKAGADKDSKEAEQTDFTDFTVPEGMQIDTAALEAFKPIAKELGLDQSGAQKMVDMYAEMQVKQSEAWGEQLESWATETKADKELTGGEGFDANLKVAQGAIRELFPDKTERQEFLDLISHTGLANHRLMAKFCLRVGKQVVDDKIVKGGDATHVTKSTAERMYPST